MAKEKKKEPIPTGRKGEYIDPATGKRFSSVTGEIPRDVPDRGGGGTIIEKGGHTFIAPPSAEKKIAELRAEGKLPSLEMTPEQKEAEQAAEERMRRKAAFQGLEEEGLIPEEEMPERVELDVERKAGEGMPLVGASIAGIGQAVAMFLKDTPLKSFVGEGQEIDNLVQTPEGRRGVMIAEIQREELDKSISATEALGALIEGIPVVGSLANEYAGDLLKTPEATTRDLRAQISEIESRASGLSDAAAQGELGNGIAVARQLDKMNNEIAKLESRIKLLSVQSPILRSNPEMINLIEEEILSARITIFEAQQRVAEGIIITKPEENLFLQLQEAKS